MKPFIKWVGGKTRTIPELKARFPIGMGTEITKYCEPFIGGGAMFLYIVANYNIKQIMINDMNKVLIYAYRLIKEDVNSLINSLLSIQKKYYSLNEHEREAYYYRARAMYNALIADVDSNIVKVVTLFIFLNKTCFNGLYRVNSKNGFNTPFGKHKGNMLHDASNLQDISKALQNVIISDGDYRQCTNFINKDTFVYIDPPYLQDKNTPMFTQYNAGGFDFEHQKKLKIWIDEISCNGARIMMSNSDAQILQVLYKEYSIQKIKVSRFVKAVQHVEELVITNY